MIAEGDDDATLNVAIGHLPDTPLPWQEGNSALAGHRDTFFRPLQHIRVGDELQLSTAHGDFRYKVRKTMVVGPDDVWVLDTTERPTLTLITCHPFRYIGTAPGRFIVTAERTMTTEAAQTISPSLMLSAPGIRAATVLAETRHTRGSELFFFHEVTSTEGIAPRDNGLTGFGPDPLEAHRQGD